MQLVEVASLAVCFRACCYSYTYDHLLFIIIIIYTVMLRYYRS